ncbi:hypothetical protein PENANT_c012G09464 [Penicillium antarcticum]|uniref:Uncharacterized protein n=1 Tax=Penicillium antarcticum TaxID=416450 RepID=A0A1V6Q6H1_9EURO|nr:hypothetical protein PENANT_c012G09464 [Penicillium antarcticum]
MSSQSPQQHWYSYNYIYAVMPSQLPVIPVIPMDTWTIPTLQPQLQPQFQPQDQSTHLPPISTLLNLLQTQPPPLEEGTAFESWYDKIIQILQSHNLSNLVSPTIPKPPIPDINNWTTHSSNVRNWLWAALTNPQIRSISTFSPNIYTLYADDLMAAIRIHAIGSGHFPLSRAMTEFMEIKRVQFPSTEIFVHELRRRFRRYSDLGGMPTPYSALAIFLRELGNGNVPPLADFILAKEEEISRLVDPGVIVTVWDFYAACEEMNLGIQAGGWDRERVMQK